MECRAVVSMLSDYLDDRDMWLSDNELRDIESHLGYCPNCQTIKSDLTEVKMGARELPLHTPSKALWTRISNIVELEVPKSERPTRIEATEKSWWERLMSRKLTFTLPQLAGVGALVVAIIMTGLFTSSRPVDSGFNFSGVQSALLPGEDRIKADIERRLSAINARKIQWDPMRRSEFELRMNKIEGSLADSRRKLIANPDDKVQQQMVLNLYDEKRQLLEDVERLKW